MRIWALAWLAWRWCSAAVDKMRARQLGSPPQHMHHQRIHPACTNDSPSTWVATPHRARVHPSSQLATAAAGIRTASCAPRRPAVAPPGVPHFPRPCRTISVLVAKASTTAIFDDWGVELDSVKQMQARRPRRVLGQCATALLPNRTPAAAPAIQGLRCPGDLAHTAAALQIAINVMVALLVPGACVVVGSNLALAWQRRNGGVPGGVVRGGAREPVGGGGAPAWGAAALPGCAHRPPWLGPQYDHRTGMGSEGIASQLSPR